MKGLHNESGQMLIMAALELVLLIGFLGLAADVGLLFHSRRSMQIAADAAATAGAMNEMDDLSTGATLDNNTDAAAQRAATANGYTNGQNGVVVTVNIGRDGQITDGYHTGPGYVEAIITKPDPLYFMKFFTGKSTATVGARAVAGDPGVSSNCAFLMDPTGDDLQFQGNVQVNSPGCTWYVNSDGSATGFTVSQTGGSATLNSPYVSSVGYSPYSSLGNAPVYSYAKPDAPPSMQEVGAVPPGDCTVTYAGTAIGTSSSTTTTATLPPTIDGGGGVVCFSGSNVDLSGETLNNGVFVFENGVIASTTTATTNMFNATLEVYGGTFTQQTNSILNIQAPCAQYTGPDAMAECDADTFGGLSYSGVALLVPAANTTYTNALCQKELTGTQKNNGALTVQIGNSGQSFDGYIVAPNAALFLNDNGGSVAITGIIAACMFNKTSQLSIINYNTAHPSTSPLRYVSLVE